MQSFNDQANPPPSLPLIVDNFAGGGGASTGIEMALERFWRSPDWPMPRQTLVPDPGEVVLEYLKFDGPDQLVMVLRAAGEGQTCPLCRQRFRRIRSRYRRCLSDLPWQAPVMAAGNGYLQKDFPEELAHR